VTTLTSGGGMPKAKFAREWQADVDEDDGSVFPDTNGTTFELVLNMMRGYPMPASLTAAERKSIMVQFDSQSLGKLGFINLICNAGSHVAAGGSTRGSIATRRKSFICFAQLFVKAASLPSHHTTHVEGGILASLTSKRTPLPFAPLPLCLASAPQRI
jgi:hypothetical protein